MLRRFAALVAFCAGGSALLTAQAAVPTGFADEVFASGLSYPVALAFLPDGRLFCAEKSSGALKLFLPGGSSAQAGTIPNVNAGGFDRGVQGIAVDPQWPARPYLYVWYNATPPAHVRLSMFTMTGDLTNASSTNLAIGSTYVVLSGIPDQNVAHQGGTIAFGPDGMLYVFVGEDYQFCPAQNLNSLLGKILRITVAGLPLAGSGPPPIATITPTGNPYSSPTPNAPLVWARGVRNPFRGEVDSVTGTIVFADVGEDTWEEINVCSTSGLNFGWPHKEALWNYPNGCGAPPTSVTPPLLQHHQLSGTRALVTLAVYRNPPGGAFAFGPAYEGNVFYSDFYDGKIRRLQPSGSAFIPAAPVAGQPDAESWAHTENTNVTDGVVGPDGALYYTQLFAGKIRRIRAGAPPTASYDAATPCGALVPAQAGSPMSFTATATAPPGGVVTLTASGVPPAATVVPPLPVSGATAQVTLSWTPGFGDTGKWPVTFAATDQNGVFRTCEVKLYVVDSLLVVSTTTIPPTPLFPGQDFLFVDLLTAFAFPFAISEPPAFAVPNDPGLIGLHFYGQVGRFNPVLNPSDVWKLSNPIDCFVEDEILTFGFGSGLTMTGRWPYRPVIGGMITFIVTQP